MPAITARTATAITKELRVLWPAPMRLATTITADGTVQITAGVAAGFHADALGRYLERATGRPWTFVSVRRLAGNGAVRITYTPAETDRVEVGADGCGCPITEEVRPNCSSIDGTERVEHRPGCWNGPAEDVTTPADTSEAPMTHGPITAAAIAAGTEAPCEGRSYNCPMRAGHPGDCEKTAYTWNVPATWALVNQRHFSRQLDHGAYVAYDMRSHPSFGTEHMPTMFANYDKASRLEPGQSAAALAAYADFLNATVAANAAAQVAKMHADAPHLIGRPCGATAGRVVRSARRVNCPGCNNWMLRLGECVEVRSATRGDCDWGLAKVEFLLNLGHVGDSEGQTGHMCHSHAKQAAKAQEVKILETLVAG